MIEQLSNALRMQHRRVAYFAIELNFARWNINLKTDFMLL